MRLAVRSRLSRYPVTQLRPFQWSASLSPEVAPTAQQLEAEPQPTPTRALLSLLYEVPPGLGVETSDQADPFQWSAWFTVAP